MPKFNATDKQDFDPLEEGEYPFLIVKADDRFGKNEPHNPYVHMQLQELTSKKNVFTNLVFSKGTRRRLTNFWRALGNKVEEDEEVEFNATDVQGREVRAYVSISEYQGDKQNNVEHFIVPDEAEVSRAPAPVPPPSTTRAVQPF